MTGPLGPMPTGLRVVEGDTVALAEAGEGKQIGIPSTPPKAGEVI